jgi:outer membrane protein assembly factor BamE (lipoprotein component of BamABCDE complex)
MITNTGRLAMAATMAVALLAGCTTPAPDCSSMVGNSKKQCHADSTNTRSPDNANNPDQGS